MKLLWNRSGIKKAIVIIAIPAFFLPFQNCAKSPTAFDSTSTQPTTTNQVSTTLAWDASLDSSNFVDTTVAGYKVYTATAPGMYGEPVNASAGAAPSSVLSLEKGQTYYFAVTAVNATGSESDKSTVLTYTVQ